MATFTVTQTTPNREKLLLRPNADTPCQEWAPQGEANNYECVDEAIANDDIDYVETDSTTYKVDLYEIPNSADLGVIQYLKVWAVARLEHPPPSEVDFKLLVASETTIGGAGLGLQDFTTYTEIDPGTDDFTVVSAIRITGLFKMNEADYIYKDLGAGYTNLTFTYCCRAKFTMGNDNLANAYFMSMTEGTIGDRITWEGDDHISNRWYNRKFRLRCDIAAVIQQDESSFTVAWDTWYYFKTIRDGIGNIRTFIYSDAAMTILLDTLLCTNDDLTTNYRYQYAVSTQDSGLNRTVNGQVESIKLTCAGSGDCGDYHESDSKYLTNAWNTSSHVWQENPMTDAAWTWANINDLAIGIKGKSSGELLDAETLTIRPNAPGDLSQWTPFGAVANWECVDDAGAHDGDTTYVRAYNTPIFNPEDLYHIQNISLGIGEVIENVTIFGYLKDKAFGYGQFKFILKTGGVISYDAAVKHTSLNYELFSSSFPLNPVTGLAWTEADINNLQIGLESGWGGECCTQIYATVSYIPASIPELQCTQLYAEVGYDPSTATCTLNVPKQISTDHSRNIKMLNFWNGTREVYDLNRSGKSMVLVGEEMYDGSCDTILCVRGLARNGAVVTIAGLTTGYFNGDFRIRQFGWNKISEKPEHYEWILDLESAD